MNKRQSAKPPPAVCFYANPVVFYSILFILGSLQFPYLYQVHSILMITLVSLAGTLPFTLGLMFSPPDYFRPGLAAFASYFLGRSAGQQGQRERYLRYVKSPRYKKMVFRYGLRLALVPYVCYAVSFIEFPRSWVFLYRVPDWIVGVSMAIWMQWMLTFICLIVSISIYFKKNWELVLSEDISSEDVSA